MRKTLAPIAILRVGPTSFRCLLLIIGGADVFTSCEALIGAAVDDVLAVDEGDIVDLGIVSYCCAQT